MPLLPICPTLKGRIYPPMEKCAAPATPRYFTEEMDIAQGKLSVGWRCVTEDVTAMILAILLFGGTSNAKLFMNVREKLSLCYYPSSSFARSKGILTVACSIESKNYGTAIVEIIAQLQTEALSSSVARSSTVHTT